MFEFIYKQIKYFYSMEMGLDYIFYVYSKKDYEYECTSESIIVKNKNGNEQYIYVHENESNFYVADMNTLEKYSVVEVHGTDDVFIIVDVA